MNVPKNIKPELCVGKSVLFPTLQQVYLVKGPDGNGRLLASDGFFIVECAVSDAYNDVAGTIPPEALKLGRKFLRAKDETFQLDATDPRSVRVVDQREGTWVTFERTDALMPPLPEIIDTADAMEVVVKTALDPRNLYELGKSLDRDRRCIIEIRGDSARPGSHVVRVANTPRGARAYLMGSRIDVPEEHA